MASTRERRSKTYISSFPINAPKLHHPSDALKHPRPQLDEPRVGARLLRVPSEHLLFRFWFEVEVVERRDTLSDGGEGDDLLNCQSFGFGGELVREGERVEEFVDDGVDDGLRG